MVGAAIGAAAIGAVGSIAAGAMGSSAAGANRKLMQEIWSGSEQAANPYQRLGNQALKLYRDRLGPAVWESMYKPFTNEEYQQSPLYTPMVRNLAELQATPGYQFQLQQGQQQIDQGAAARNGVLNGAQQKATANWGQQQAATGFQAAWDRAQQAYQKAFDVHNTEQASNRAGIAQGMNIIQNATNTGYQAAMAPWQIAQGLAPSVMQSNMTGADMMGQGIAGAGTAINNGIYALAQPKASVYWGAQPAQNTSYANSLTNSLYPKMGGVT